MGCAFAQSSSSCAVFGGCFTASGMYSMMGPAGQNTTHDRLVLRQALHLPAHPADRCPAASAAPRRSRSPAAPTASGRCRPTAPSVPVSTRSISTRPAACCAFSLPGNSGAGAWEKAIFDTSLGFALANPSIAPWVSCNWPATSIDIERDGCGWQRRREAAPGRDRRRIAAKPAMPPSSIRRSNGCPDHGRFSLGRASRSVAPGTVESQGHRQSRIDLDH